MWLKWLPWRYVVRRVARAHGFLDPIALLGQLHRFAQPSEVAMPLELLRAGAVFHARGLMNSQAIQHNLDWVWPYWVERQFDPRDTSFIPRAFSITHVNLSHRNWTAVGLPDCEALPIVDPRGLLTPWWNGWSVDAWVLADDGTELLPSRSPDCSQRLELEPDLRVSTESRRDGLRLRSSALVVAGEHPTCRQDLEAESDRAAWLVVSLRPTNPEGVAFLHDLELSSDRQSWRVDDAEAVRFAEPVERHDASNYELGDVHAFRGEGPERTSIHCDVGMATAAASFGLAPGVPRRLSLEMPLHPEEETRDASAAASPWSQALGGACATRLPDEWFQFLWDAALRTLVLHCPHEAWPGPFTYKRFWFRDAVFMTHALICSGLVDRARRVIAGFFPRQTPFGYFLSQEGEWDSNGQVLWLLDRFAELSGEPLDPSWIAAADRGARWIARKRQDDDAGTLHAGLLPAGFSAEHLGPSDHYYWDDFWSLGGLRSAARLLAPSDPKAADGHLETAAALEAAVERSLEASAAHRRFDGLPAAPGRRMDAGAIGSLAVDYPLQAWPPGERRVRSTVEFLMERCFVNGGFFQDMIHSGINAYLTLHVAQVLMRAHDRRGPELMQVVADLASPTGQWPEAIHPRTLGGCMGDGQHAWAAAEWLLAQRAAFVREEGDTLVLGAGIPRSWQEDPRGATLGPTPTRFGPVSVVVAPRDGRLVVSWRGDWRVQPGEIRVTLPDRPAVTAGVDDREVEVAPVNA